MRLMLIFTLFFMTWMSEASAGPLAQQLRELSAFEDEVSQNCSSAHKATYAVEVEGKTLHCKELIVVAHRQREALEGKFDELEACEPSDATPVSRVLTGDIGHIVKTANACTPSPDRNQCLSKFGCSFLTTATAGPLNYLLKSAANLTGNTQLKQCASEGSGRTLSCMQNIIKGIVDNIWGMVKGMGQLASMAWNKAGEWLGIYEKETSRKNHLAQNATDDFLEQMLHHPIETISNIASGVYKSIQKAAMENYACPKKLPSGECATPIPQWNCASCEQKTNVICGVAGYAIGEIGTSIITGGLFKGAVLAGKSLARISKVPAGKMAAIFAESFPKVNASVKAGAEVLIAGGRRSGAGLSKAQGALKASLHRSGNLPAAKFIAQSFKSASQGAPGILVRGTLKPVSLYLKALTEGAKLGAQGVESAAIRVTGSGAKATEGVVLSREVAASSPPHSPRPEIAQADELAQASNFSKMEREEKASEVLGRNLDGPQKACLNEAHLIGAVRGFGHYSRADLISKKNVLEGCGFSRQEVISLMDRGIAGGYATTFEEGRHALIDSADSLKKIDRMTEPTAFARGVTPEQIKEQADLYRAQIKTASDGFYNESLRLHEAQKMAQSWEMAARAGDVETTVARIQAGVKEFGMIPERIVSGLEAKISGLDRAIAKWPENPLLKLERKTLDEVLKRTVADFKLPGHGGVTRDSLIAAASPSKIAVPKDLSARPLTPPIPKPAQVVSPVDAAPKIRPVDPVPKAPVDPITLNPMQAKYTANDYRLGTNGKVVDPNLASTYYLRASEDFIAKETKLRRISPSGDSKYFDDQSFYSAFSESLKGDGKVAQELVKKVYEKGGSREVNAMMHEMYMKGIGSRKSQIERVNFQQWISEMESTYKKNGELFTPQENYLRGWKSENYVSE
jgi:hypothetical protein